MIFIIYDKGKLVLDEKENSDRRIMKGVFLSWPHSTWSQEKIKAMRMQHYGKQSVLLYSWRFSRYS